MTEYRNLRATVNGSGFKQTKWLEKSSLHHQKDIENYKVKNSLMLKFHTLYKKINQNGILNSRADWQKGVWKTSETTENGVEVSFILI